VLLLVSAAKQPLRDPKLWETFFYMGTFSFNLFAPTPELYGSRMPAWGAGGHFWSICVEEQFYLVAPLAMVVLKRFRAPLLVGIVALNWFFAHDFAAIALGVLLAMAHARFGRLLATPLVQLGFVAVLLSALGLGTANVVDYAQAAPFGAASAVALLAHPGTRNELTSFIGGVSYPFYLNHWLGIILAHGALARLLFGRESLGLIAGFVVALSLSSAHYLAIDRNIQRRRGSWFTQRRGVLALIVSVSVVALGLAVGSLLRIHPIP
jgi:peptidoglycan/LPS O-acetylase OafA/YrhL